MYVCVYVCMYVCTYVCNTYVAFLCVGIPEGGLCMYPQGLWLCCPEIYVCTYVCTKGVYVHMCVCIYVSKSNEGSQLIYIQPWAQGCRQGGWPLRGVRGCRPPSSPWHQFTPEFPNKLPGKFPLCMYFSKKGSHRLPRSIPNERKVFQKVTLGVYLQQYLVLLANSLVIFFCHTQTTIAPSIHSHAPKGPATRTQTKLHRNAGKLV